MNIITEIAHVILEGNMSNDVAVTREQVQAYADLSEQALQAAYPGAEITTTVRWNCAGVGGGCWAEDADGLNADASENCRYICDQVFADVTWENA